jgi:signal peptide peptidase SppA
MKYHQILAALSGPLLITPESHASIFKLFTDHARLSPAEFQATREGVDFCGEAVELPQMEIIDGVAHIPIGGPLGRGLGKFEKGAGADDYGDIADEVGQADGDDSVAGILLDIDSPGGMFSGLPELSDQIARVEKPIYAYSAGLMCSAAYWIGASCDMIFCTKTATIGNVGVYCAYLDQSKAYEDAGYKVDLFTSGKYKGAGYPGTSLTKDHRQMLTDEIKEMAEMFYEHVLANRSDVVPADMQGQAFLGVRAEAAGFADKVVAGKDEVVSLLTGV